MNPKCWVTVQSNVIVLYISMPKHIGPRERVELWSCLSADNHISLKRTLSVYGFHSCEDLKSLELDLWHLNGGKGREQKQFGIAAVCAINLFGVPSDGAPNCLRMLFERFGENVLGTAEPEVLERISSLNRPLIEKLLIDNKRPPHVVRSEQNIGPNFV